MSIKAPASMVYIKTEKNLSFMKSPNVLFDIQNGGKLNSCEQ